MNASRAVKVRYLHNPKDGDPGPAGPAGPAGSRGPYIPGYMPWSSYPSGYQFKSGAAGESRMDIVLLASGNRLIPYYCKASHTKGTTPPNQDTAHWGITDAGVYDCLATNMLLADNARVEFMSGQAIRVGAGTTVWGYFGTPAEGGEIIYTGGATPAEATFMVDLHGNARWGAATAQRIEVDPIAAALRIFDSSGALRTTMSGERKDPATAIPGGGADTSLTGGTTLAATATGSHTVIAENTASAAGTVSVNVPAMTITAKANDMGSGAGSSGPVMQPYTNVAVTIQVWVGGKVVARRQFSGHAYYEEAATGSDPVSVERTFVTQPTAITAAVKKNDKVKVTVEVGITKAGGTGSGGSGSVTAGTAFSGKFVYSGVQCIYATNGICISSNSDNYFFALFDTSGTLHIGCKAAGTVKI